MIIIATQDGGLHDCLRHLNDQLGIESWNTALKRAGIEDFRWHDLRHAWASWHVQNGTPLRALQEQEKSALAGRHWQARFFVERIVGVIFNKTHKLKRPLVTTITNGLDVLWRARSDSNARPLGS